MTVDDVYSIIKFAVKKNQNGTVTSNDFNRIINLASDSYKAFLCGNMEGYQVGHPLPKAEFGNNRTARQRLTPSIYNYVLNIDAITGISPYPLDYIQTDSMNSIYGVQKIRFAPQHKLVSIYNSVIDPISSNPIYLITDYGFQFHPSNLWRARLSYVRETPPIRWAWTLDGNGREVYDPVNSVDPVWDNVAIYEVIVRALALIGLNLQLGSVMQYSEQIKQTGQ